VDTRIEEELCMSVRLTVAIDSKGQICTIQKGGKGGLEQSLVLEMLNSARKIGINLLEQLNKALKHEEELEGKRKKLGFFA